MSAFYAFMGEDILFSGCPRIHAFITFVLAWVFYIKSLLAWEFHRIYSLGETGTKVNQTWVQGQSRNLQGHGYGFKGHYSAVQ